MQVTMADVEAIEREFYGAICLAGDSACLSELESAEAVFRKCSTLLHGVKRVVRQLEHPQHRERYVPHPQARQRSFDYA